MRCNAPQPRCHSRSPEAVSSKSDERPSSGFGRRARACVSRAAARVRGRRQRHAELGGELGQPDRAAGADQAQHRVAVRGDAVGSELALDELRHPLVGGDEQQEQREPAFRRRGGAALRAGRAGAGRCRRHPIRDDVVGALEHRHLVDGQRRAGKPLGEPRAGARDADRDVQQAAALPEHPGDRQVELVPVTTSGPPISNVRFAAAGGRSRARNTRRRRRPRSAASAAGPGRSPSRPASSAPAG